MEALRKKFIPHLISFFIFVTLAIFFASPAMKGMRIDAHDTNQNKGMSKEIWDHRDEYQEEPLWTNSMFGGMPSFQISIAYPKNLVRQIDKVLGLGLPHPINTIFKSMIGFYILLIILRVPWEYSIAGAIAFSLSTYFIIILQAGHNTKAIACAYMAPTIGGVILAYRGRIMLGGVITALFFSLNIAANHLQVTYYLGLSLLLFGLIELGFSIKNKTLKTSIPSILVCVGALVLSLAVNNTNIRLTQEYVKLSQRGTSELEIKKRQKEEKAKQATEARENAIKRAKKQEELDAQNKKIKEEDKFVFNEADYLPGDKAYATNYSYGWGESLSLLVPNIRGGGGADEHKGTKANKAFKSQSGMLLYWGKQPSVSGPVYIGACIIFLFVLGAITVKNNYKWWLIGTFILGLFISYGKNFLPFFNFMFDYFPFYKGFRAVTIGMVISELAAPILGFLLIKEIITGEIEKERVLFGLKIAGGTLVAILLLLYLKGPDLFEFSGRFDDKVGERGANILQKERIKIFKEDILRSLLFVLLSAGTVFILIKSWFKPQYVAIILGLVVIADLYPVNQRYLNEDNYVKKKKSKKPFNKKPAYSIFLNDPSEFRVFNTVGGYGSAINDASTAYFAKDIAGYSSVKLMIYQDLLDLSLGQEMQQVSGTIQQMLQQINGIDRNYTNQLLSKNNIINMLNTKYIIYDNNKPAYENPFAFGNAWLIKNKIHHASPDSVMFNLRKENLRESALIIGENSNKQYSAQGAIKLINYKTNHLTYEFESSSNQFAVFSEVYYKDWNAYIDDELVDIIRSNYALRGLEVPVGKHKIEFKFEPAIYYQGENISLIASLILFGLLGFVVYKEIKFIKQQTV